MNLLRFSRRALLALAAAVLLPAQANIAPPEVVLTLPSANLVGASKLRFLVFPIYAIRLWSPATAAEIAHRWDSLPLALEIEYTRPLDGDSIAERTLAEMRRQGPIDTESGQLWLATLKRLIPDVVEGDRITGVQQPGVGTRIYLNGVLRGELRDAEFTRLFFGIWLSPRTSEPGLRQGLVGARS